MNKQHMEYMIEDQSEIIKDLQDRLFYLMAFVALCDTCNDPIQDCNCHNDDCNTEIFIKEIK